jgi:8-oxo-dGTP pyrophosphatase MutT (NUDIX family)
MNHLDLGDNIIKNVRAIIRKNEGGQTLYLLTQEPTGSFTIPGGCKDLEDADLRSALQRELWEELSLSPGDYSLTDTPIQKRYGNLYDDPGSERRGKDTIIYIFLISNLKKEPTPTSEVKNAVWLTKEKALDAFNAPHMTELFELGVKQ